MVKSILLSAAIVMIATFAAAKDNETIEQLQARAQSAEINKQPELYVELSRRQVEAADDAYNNNVDQARTLLEQGTKSGELAANKSVETGKHLKKVEIELRKINSRLVNMQRSWAFEDQQVVQEAVKRIDVARSKLLERMFRK
jgi:hypothetical protein